jgi:hypothetical protein
MTPSRELCKDQQEASKHRRKVGAASLQDLTAREHTAQGPRVVQNREPGTLEMAQAEQQKTPPPEPAFAASCLIAQTHHA